MIYQHSRAALRPLWPLVAVRWGLALALLLAVAALGFIWLGNVRFDGREALATTPSARASQAAELTARLTRSGSAAEGLQVEVILATPTFFRLTNRAEEAAKLGADRALVFVANESVHYGPLPSHFAPILRVDGDSLHVPSETRVLIDAVHHRTSVLVFGGLSTAVLEGNHSLELLLPQASGGTREVLQWSTPIDYSAGIAQPRALSLGLVLSLLAGFLAAMWPCLFQLTAYFIPSLAGISMQQAHNPAAVAGMRWRVVQTALLFAAGITIVYTAAGAVAGYAAQSLEGSALFEALRRPLTVGAGLFVIGMALRVAARARVPLVCKMPLLSARTDRPMGPLATMVTGVAFATGCMSCFGAVMALGMLTYITSTGSALSGALILFLFSLGISVPLVVAASAMAQVLPLLGRLERWAPALGVASSLVMLGFGALLLTDNYHVVSDLVARLVGAEYGGYPL